ncbi:MAG: sugar phosphate isomerase/epimerase [Opitutaceae bacterium]|nr:sugar phosphate isomerase/epimerase [Opitutaceae bacterium]
MRRTQLAAQLFTIREHARDAAGLAASLRRIRAIGYTAVQVSGVAKLPEAELKRMLDGEGLVCCATHEPGEQILSDPPAVIARLQALDCKLTAYPNAGGLNLTDEAELDRLIARLEDAATRLAAAGLTLGYHNHDTEFMHCGGRPVLEHIFNRTKHLVAELDTYWIQAGGGDPVDWCRRMHGRLPFIHLKDYALSAPRQPYFAEIGRGNLDWARLLPAAEAAGCQWFIVERDSGETDPFDSLQASYNWLCEHHATA